MSTDAITRQELYLQYLAGDTSITLPEPVTRIEKYWWDIAQRISAGGTGTGASHAKYVLYDNSTSGLSAENLQDAVDELNEQIVNQGGGLTQAQVTALHDVVTHIGAWTDGNAQTYIKSFETAFGIESEPVEPDDPAVTLTSISATYTGGDVAVGTAVTALTGITVTAHYSDDSTQNVTGYTLSGTIAEGSNIITVTYEGLTATFTVTGVAEEPEDTRTLLNSFDFTKSLVDSVGNVTATLNGNATQDGDGVKITDATSYVSVPIVSTYAESLNKTYEFDISSDSTQTFNGSHGRFITFPNANQGLIYRNTGYWALYSTLSNWTSIDTTTFADTFALNGKTLKITIDGNYTAKAYVDGVLIAENTFNTGESATFNFAMCIGSNGTSATGMIVTSMRVYEGVA